MEFKELYSFSLDKEEEVKKETSKTNKKTGEVDIKIKTVKEKVPYVIKLKRPSRRELEEAELEYSVEKRHSYKSHALQKIQRYGRGLYRRRGKRLQ